MPSRVNVILNDEQAVLANCAAVVAQPSTPTTEMLFDVIQVCEISLSVASLHQFEAWVRGPLRSLMPHFGLLVWTQGDGRVFAGSPLVTVESGWSELIQLAKIDTTRFVSEASRCWMSDSRTPVVLNAKCVREELPSRLPDGAQIVIHGVDPRLCGAEDLFALICDGSLDAAKLLCLTQLIAPYLQLALQRIRGDAKVPQLPRATVSNSPPPARLSAREIEILECVWDGKSNAEIGTALSISRYTVKTHLQRTYRKLKVATRVQAVARAHSLKLLAVGASQFDPKHRRIADPTRR